MYAGCFLLTCGLLARMLMFQSTYNFMNAFTQLGHSCQKVHHSGKDLILHCLELSSSTTAASLALECTLTVPFSARQLALPRSCKRERKGSVKQLEIDFVFC